MKKIYIVPMLHNIEQMNETVLFVNSVPYGGEGNENIKPEAKGTSSTDWDDDDDDEMNEGNNSTLW